MDYIFIFGAKYLFIASLVASAWYFRISPLETRKKLALFLLFSLPLSYLVGLGARALYFNPRPFVVENFEPLIAHAPDNGFPSDHILLVGAVASAMLFFNRKYAWWLWGIVFFVAVSRIYAGIHHLADIMTSVVIALLCAILVKTFYGEK